MLRTLFVVLASTYLAARTKLQSNLLTFHESRLASR